ncbi:MAG TPA: hypothetical protein VHN20_13685 [Beijerinckiaceae bacterium]|nr:hypothetical protein [Beijerinckiaceae bacterium]
MGRFVSIRGSGSWAHFPTRLLFLSLLLPCAALLGAVFLQPWMPAVDVLRAPPAPTPGNLFAGAVGRLGGLLCVATASVCLFTALLAHIAGAGRSRSLFFVAAALFSIGLGVDASLRFSAGAAAAGKAQGISALVLAAGLMAYAAASWRFVLAGRATLLMTGGMALAASEALPVAVSDPTPLWLFAEDALRFVGITFWTGFHIVAAAQSGEAFATGRVTTVTLSPERIIRRAA